MSEHYTDLRPLPRGVVAVSATTSGERNSKSLTNVRKQTLLARQTRLKQGELTRGQYSK